MYLPLFVTWMSRHFGKFLFTWLAVLWGFWGITAACSISPHAGREYAFADSSCNVPEAILIVRDVVDSEDHFQWFLNERDKDVRYMAVPTNRQRMEYDSLYTGLVYNIRFNQNRKSTSKLLSSLQWLLPDMRAKYKDELLPFEDRTKFAYLYFLNLATVEALRDEVRSWSDNDWMDWGPSIPTTNEPSGSTDWLTFIQTYFTLNGKEYSLWRSDLFYLFSRGSSTEVNVARRARGLDDLINYLEYQNRIVVIAPNGRYYAIWVHDNKIQVSRDNGSVINATFESVDAAKNMLNICAVNGLVPANLRPICQFWSYGKR